MIFSQFLFKWSLCVYIFFFKRCQKPLIWIGHFNRPRNIMISESLNLLVPLHPWNYDEHRQQRKDNQSSCIMSFERGKSENDTFSNHFSQKYFHWLQKGGIFNDEKLNNIFRIQREWPFFHSEIIPFKHPLINEFVKHFWKKGSEGSTEFTLPKSTQKTCLKHIYFKCDIFQLIHSGTIQFRKS